MQTQDSRLSPIGYRNGSCGYCHQKSGSQSQKRFSYYASATTLTPAFYQALLDRGWRRSGKLLYKPDLRAGCCPQYTIRLDSEKFRPIKDHRQVQNRFNKYILGNTYINAAARLYPRSREQAKKRKNEFHLLERVHESESEQVKTPPEPAHALTVTLETDDFTEEKYLVYENYQRQVHHDAPSKISRSGFTNFLCSSPLSRSKEKFNGRDVRLGSYHQCYRIDGKLVAVGVLDLLPQCVSAVYFMYHESVQEHVFGKLSALREIALSREEGYKWWYAGFYIHSCAKMRYKGDYSPQYVLDPESLKWDLLDKEVKKKLDVHKYLSLSHPPNSTESATQPQPMDIDLPWTKISAESKASSDSEVLQDSDSDDDPPIPDPHKPLFERNMPGILTKDQILETIDLDEIRLRVRTTEAKTCHLVGWEDQEIDSPNSVKLEIAELAAAVGGELARRMVVQF